MASRFVGFACLIGVVGCGLAQPSPSGQAGAGADAGSGGGASVADPGNTSLPAQGEYWIQTDQFSAPLHVGLAPQGLAIVLGPDPLPLGFSVESSSSDLVVDPEAAVTGSKPVLRGPLLLRANHPLSENGTGISAIALRVDNPDVSADNALIAYAHDSLGRTCGQTPHQVWTTLSGRVIPDHDETQVSSVGWDTPRGRIPWKEFALEASKPTMDTIRNGKTESFGLVADEFRVDGVGVVESQAGNGYLDLQLLETLVAWEAAVGRSVKVTGHAVNTNGAGNEPPGTSAWSTSWDMLDFGPMRSGQLDFGAGAPADLVTWGTESLSNDGACAEAATASAAALPSCLRVKSGSGLAVRFAGPVVGLTVHAHGDGPVDSFIQVAAPNQGEIAMHADLSTSRIDPPADELFVVIAPPTSFASKTDATCVDPADFTLYLESLEPIAP